MNEGFDIIIAIFLYTSNIIDIVLLKTLLIVIIFGFS
jgi:hypothetical protein